MEALEVLRALAPREEALIAVYRRGALSRLIDSRALEQALLLAGTDGSPPGLRDIAPQTARLRPSA